MLRAVALSRRGFPAPNPHVGCVIVKNGSVVGEGWHRAAGEGHAEVVALANAGRNAKGADVYVTLEPCNHFGRTGPCSEALVRAEVKRVFIAVPEPNAVAAGGADRLRSAGIEVSIGLCESEARAANEVFIFSCERGRPYVCAKAAVTLDGFMAREGGTSKWITGPAARRAGHRLRAEMGAVLVGQGTVIADDPQLTARIPGVVNQPLRVVLDPHGRLSGTEQVFGPHGEALWVVSPEHRSSDRQTVCAYDGGFDLDGLLQMLAARGVRGVLVEGGPATIRSFVTSGLVDRLELFISGTLFRTGKSLWSEWSDGLTLNLSKVKRHGSDVQLTYRVL